MANPDLGDDDPDALTQFCASFTLILSPIATSILRLCVARPSARQLDDLRLVAEQLRRTLGGRRG